ncbi:MAG: sugar phosphate isomerase/epimerase [Fimbriimonadales bacterium]|nr:sugar phosphate isomerase/epimerase [Fimbriimonadales bacterium]
MRYALCNVVLRHRSFEAACRVMAEAGYQGVELAPLVFAPSVELLDADARATIRRTANAFGLEIVGLHMLLWGRDDLHVAHPDPEVRRRTGEYLVQLVQFAESVGAPQMVFGSPKQRSTIPPITREQALQLWLDTLQPALRACEQSGVLILLEPLPPAETDVLNTLSEAIAILEAVRHPCLGTLLDVKCALSETENVPALIRRYAPFIQHVHLNDRDMRAPGFGPTDFTPILSALREVGYSGWCSVEPLDYTPDPEQIAWGAIRYLLQCEAQ